MDSPVSVALVGFGFAGRAFHAPLIDATPGLVLHTVVSRRADAVREHWPAVRVVPTLEDVLADPAIGLVVIATPNALHAPQAAQALSAGKHVVIDKPFTVTVAEGEALVAQAARAGRLLSVFHNRRWDSDFLTLQALVRDGVLGDVRFMAGHFDRYRPVVRERWREQAGPGAGLWYDLGPHLIDQALVLFGAPTHITADLLAQRDGAVVDDYAHVILHYPQRRVVLHAASLVAAHGPRFVVHGTDGSYGIDGLDPQEAALLAGDHPGRDGWGHDPREGRLTAADGVTRTIPTRAGAYPAYYAGVCAAIRGTGTVPVRAEEALRVMRVLEAAVQSAQTQRTVAVDA